MTKKALTILAVSVLVVAAAVPLMAQTFRVTANVPFEFTASGKLMPAGEYALWNGSDAGVIFMRDDAANVGALAMGIRAAVNVHNPATDTKLVFNRYGNHYFLSEVVDGYMGSAIQLPRTPAERELAKTASLQREEVVAVLAQR